MSHFHLRAIGKGDDAMQEGTTATATRQAATGAHACVLKWLGAWNRGNTTSVARSADESPGRALGLRMAHILTKYGIAMSATPIATRRMVFVRKYGKTISPMPQNRGTTVFCFLP